MNPYVSFSIAMCAIVFLALAATAYMAVYFNRKAKADLVSALTPLASVLASKVDVEEAAATGRFAGHIAEGRVANTPNGPGRVFFTSVVDNAGGTGWKWTARQPKQGELETTFESARPDLEASITPLLTERVLPTLIGPGWLQVDYDPEPARVRLTRPMSTRRAIPGAEQFVAQLEALVAIADANRAVQEEFARPG